ncbi:hypothetical protein AB0F17_46470 [Nonomuraea sp. NPDC026600]|uniref:Lrp/AsnC family transcriptional regulator n=1 Tax=Nonomuraea sp. NPDC026600 TaxID=3155363 RepID=UPI0033DF24CA
MSDQTVARRYHKLRSAGLLKVIGQVQARRLGWAQWFVRIQVVPIAEALARRADTSWVSLTGGTQIVCVVRARSFRERDALLLGQLPRTPQVVGVTAHCLLRIFAGGPPAGTPLRRAPRSRSSTPSPASWSPASVTG